MLSRALVVRPFFCTLLSALVPQRTLHRITFAIVAMCLASVVINAVLLTHAQSTRVFISNIGTHLPTASGPASTRPVGAINASKSLVRIDQSSISQYSSQLEHDTWWSSTCSAASMTEVMNAYGHHYKITDVLKIEASLGAITPDQGLLDPKGIDETANKFSFTTQTLNTPTLDQIIDIANGGKPVIVNFPPQTWAGGHFLVVVGGETIDGVAYVHLADSSKLNMQYMQQGRFLSYWRGFAKVLSPRTASSASTSAGPHSVLGAPSMSVDAINRVLQAYNSPAAGKGQALYDMGKQYGIDPAFALAFFMHESSFGTKGEARTSLSLGNLRCIPNAECRDGYAWFPSWEAGFNAWYELIRNLYVTTWGLTTIEQIIPKYAPAADNNDEQAYVNALTHALDTWHAGGLKP